MFLYFDFVMDLLEALGWPPKSLLKSIPKKSMDATLQKKPSSLQKVQQRSLSSKLTIEQ